MRLQEFQVKRIFREYGIPVPKGEVATTISEVVQITHSIVPPVIVKAQVLTKNRSRYGGIRLAKSVKSANEITTEMFGISINGLPVEKILVEAALDIEKEYYLGIAIDYAKQVPVLIAAAVSGVKIDELASNSPEDLFLSEINPLIGLRDYNIFSVMGGLELDRSFWKDFYEIAHSLWHVFVEKDAILIEVNPLVATTDGYLIAVDGRMILDDKAIFRQNDIDIDEMLVFLSEFQRQGRSYDLQISEFDGEIGCLVNNTALGRLIADQFDNLPEELSHCIVMEGNASAARVEVVLNMMASQRNTKVMIVVLSSGFLDMNEIADGIISYLEKTDNGIPIIVCLKGGEVTPALQRLQDSNVFTYHSLEDVIERAISCVHFTSSKIEGEL